MKAFKVIVFACLGIGVIVGFYTILHSVGGSIMETDMPLGTFGGGVYANYDGTIPASGDSVLFFHADRCPICIAAKKNYDQEGIPTGLNILELDFDTQDALKQKYNILTQNSYVYVSPDGTLIKRWIGGTTIEDIIKHVQDAKGGVLKPREKAQLENDSGALDLSGLTEMQLRVTQQGGTEKPFENEYRDNEEPGIYVDVIDGTPLFSSTDKFNSGTGRPSFTKPIGDSNIDQNLDMSLGVARNELKSDTSKAHLGHVFNDGPVEAGGKRYCINSAALKFIPVAEMEAKGYGEWLYLFDTGTINK